MAEHPRVAAHLWQAFLRRHYLGPQDHTAFLAFLARNDALPIESVQDLEDDYLDYLHRGGPSDPAQGA